MRAPAALACLIGVMGGAVLVAMAGRALVPAGPPAVNAPVANDGVPEPAKPTNILRLAAKNDPAPAPGPVRPVAPETIAQPDVDPAGLEREAPRQPLSRLSLALPPRPTTGNDWDGVILYQPVVTASARFEAMGYDVSIAGAESLDPSETCERDGTDWPCGARARTAFRYWLRGRAPTCALAGSDATTVVAACRLGKQDAGAWLVSHGWARATPGGPYVEAGEKARESGLGIFGPPPSAAN